VKRSPIGDGELAGRHGAAGVARIDVLHALAVEEHADFVVGNDLRAGFRGNLHRIADVIVVAMCQHDMRDAGGHGVEVALEDGAPLEEGVDQNDGASDLETNGRVAEPGELHERCSRLRCAQDGRDGRGRQGTAPAVLRAGHVLGAGMSDNVITVEDLSTRLPARARIMGLDLGTKTIGVAVSDLERSIATPVETIRRQKFSVDVARLLDLAKHQQAAAFVIGLPLNMDGSEGPRVQSTRAFVRNCAALTSLPFVYWDERLSTAAVTRSLIEQDASRAKRAEVVDRMAAAYILQGALDRLGYLGRARG
jgi:putative Holliday junction resolvase